MSWKKFTIAALLFVIPTAFSIQSCGTVVDSRKTKKRMQKQRHETAKKKRKAYRGY